MTVRERLEQAEASQLSPYAAKSAQTRGREHPISEDCLRTEYQRDRDRILHCKSFRRLKNKTQMLLSPEGDHYRTRLTHTLEVAQVARTLARALRLNEDLAEAIALGHDLGHTPFGHMGERTLDRLMQPLGFLHNEHSRRVVEALERGGKGLNLTWEVRDGIAHHSDRPEPATLEAWCVRRADRIAYINHDIDDAVRAGILREDRLPKDCLAVLGRSHGERINTMITDIIAQSEGQAFVRMSPEVEQASEALRDFMFGTVYRGDWAVKEEERADRLMQGLFTYFAEHPQNMPQEFSCRCAGENVQRVVCDYIASMTDRYAVRIYHKHFVPESFVVIG